MSEYLIQDTTLTGIADKIRPLLGLTGTMTPEQMQTNLTTEQANITAALAALAEKGVDVPAGSNSNALAGLIAAIEAGGGSVSIGDVTLAESGNSIELEHNLGAIPNKAVLIRGANGVAKTRQTLFVVSEKKTGARCVYSGSSSTVNVTTGISAYFQVDAYKINGDFVSADDKKLTITVPAATMEFSAGITYTVVCEVTT